MAKKIVFGDSKKLKKKVRKKSLSSLKKKLDSIFSIWIRMKDVDINGEVCCYTCGKKSHWKYLQCGHFMSRRHHATRWDEENCKPQCAGCNIFNQGNGPMFSINLQRDCGQDILLKLSKKAHTICKMSREDYEEYILKYKQLIKKLDGTKNK